MEIGIKLICSAIFIGTCFTNICFAVNKVNIDLSTENTKDRITVELLDLEFQGENEVLLFPSVIPGMYEKNDFGQYISDVFATLKDGEVKKLKRRKINAFLLSQKQYSILKGNFR